MDDQKIGSAIKILSRSPENGVQKKNRTKLRRHLNKYGDTLLNPSPLNIPVNVTELVQGAKQLTQTVLKKETVGQFV